MNVIVTQKCHIHDPPISMGITNQQHFDKCVHHRSTLVLDLNKSLILTWFAGRPQIRV